MQLSGKQEIEHEYSQLKTIYNEHVYYLFGSFIFFLKRNYYHRNQGLHL